MSTHKEMQAVAEALYREGWNAALDEAIKVVDINGAAEIRKLKK